MENKDFVVFIITHGRPDKVITLKTLNKCGYTGDLYLVLDDEDKTVHEYIKNYGLDKIIVFNKKEMADKVDEGNNFNNRRTTTHARNACFDIAEKLGKKYFLVLDDDYGNFRYRYIDKYITKGYVNNLNTFFDSVINFYKKSNFDCIALAQGGDFIGGEGCGMIRNYLYYFRKLMNTFFCSTEKRFNFIGQLNEDVNTYVTLGAVGHKFMTIPFIGVEQSATQSLKGGMTDAYLQYGTYIKSFTTVMMHPSSIRVSMMGFNSKRLHHLTKWKYTTPMILNEKYKK